MIKKGLLVIMGLFFIFTFCMGCIDGSADNDSDGVPNSSEEGGWEVSVYRIDGTIEKKVVTSDPDKTDTDGDGLDDYEEMTALSDPTSSDTDGDGLSDKDEATYGSSSIHFDSWIITVRGETKRVIADYSKHGNSAVQYDSDFDGLSDSEEYYKGADPLDNDTDDDGDGDFIDPNPGWNLKVELQLEEFNLKRVMDVAGGADLYFILNIGDETLTTDVWDISVGTEDINRLYTIDFPDKNAHPDNELDIMISAFDEDGNTLFGYTPIEIDGTKESYSLQYDVTDFTINEYTTDGDDGNLKFSIEIIKT